MCGIAGLQLRAGKPIDPFVLRRLEVLLRHRGPDSAGSFVHGSTGLVSTRLAIVDLLHGGQPLHSSDGTVLVANAEIYNAPELRAQFPDFPYRTNSDCEVIFPLFQAYGLDFAKHLRGMYALALFEPARQRLILARDPFGIKPLYICSNEAGFSFASELGALIAAGLAEPQQDAIARAEFLQLKYVVGTKTIIEGVRRVRPGETLSVQDSRVRQDLFPADWVVNEQQSTLSRITSPFQHAPQAMLTQFEEVMRDSVSAHLRADVPVCLFYSGGIDSTVLLLTARDLAPDNFSALTVGYPGNERVDESYHALKLAEAAGVKCDRVEMTSDDFWNFAPRIVAAVDDAMADPAVLPLFMLARAARLRGYKVILCGEGADELFGGYSRYQRATLPAIPRKGRRRGVFDGVGALDLAEWSTAMDSVEQDEESFRWTRLQVLQAIDLKQRLPNCLLIKLDRATMANGVEGRTPFLDRRVAKFALQLPDALKANPRIGKRLLRDWVHAKLPEARPYAKKRGFDLPLARWMNERKSILAELVSEHRAIRSVIPSDVVNQAFECCAEAAQPAWNLLAYALWYSHHVLQMDADGNIEEVLGAATRRSPSVEDCNAGHPREQGDLSGYPALGNRGPVPTLHAS